MEKVFTNLVMEEFIKEDTKTTKNTDMENIYILMANSIKACGRMENNMVQECILIRKE